MARALSFAPDELVGKRVYKSLGVCLLHCQRCLPVFQFILHDSGEDHFFKQRWQNVDMPDKDQVVDRPGVGDDQPHHLEADS